MSYPEDFDVLEQAFRKGFRKLSWKDQEEILKDLERIMNEND